jgi:hypothetical protein
MLTIAPAGGGQVRYSLAGAADRAEQCGVEVLMPHFVGELCEHAEAAQCGVIHQDVEPAELGHSVLHRGTHRFRVRDVARQRQRADLFGGVCTEPRVLIGDENLRAFGHELARNLFADTAPCPCDQHRVPLEPSHEHSSR